MLSLIHIFFENEQESSIALMGNVSMHQQKAGYGLKIYDVNEKNAYASLVFEDVYKRQVKW